MSDIQASVWLRAGFWRRLWAFVVDLLLICVPLQIVVAALYPVTNGKIQMSSGISFNLCNSNVSLANLPAVVNPPSMHANAAAICRSSFFGLETARWLTVSRVTQEGAVTKTFSIYYRLDRDNKVAQVYAVDWVAFVGIFIYLVSLERRLGTTLGKRLLGLRVIALREADRTGIPFGAAVLRNIFLWIGCYPLLIVLLGAYVLGLWNVEGFMSGGIFSWFMGSGLVGFAIYMWIVVEVARKRDPIYDLIARTAVVRDNPTMSPVTTGP